MIQVILLSRAWYGMEEDFSIFHTGNFLPFHTENLLFHIPFHTKIFFHIPLRTSIQITFRLEATQRTICTFAMLKVTTREGARNITKMQRPVFSVHRI